MLLPYVMGTLARRKTPKAYNVLIYFLEAEIVPIAEYVKLAVRVGKPWESNNEFALAG